MLRKLAFAFGLSAAFVVAAPAQGQVTIGADDDGNCLPFGCANQLNVTRVQHQYSASAFAAPIDITKLSFFCTVANCNPNATFGTANFTVVLSTSTRAMAGLEANLDSNVGADAQAFFTGTFSGTYGTGFTILGSSFMYDPTDGNLLVDVFVNGGADSPTFSFLNAGFSPDADRRTSSGESNIGYGLQIGVNVDTGNYPGQTVVPEPASMALVGLGLLGIAAARRRQSRSASVSHG